MRKSLLLLAALLLPQAAFAAPTLRNFDFRHYFLTPPSEFSSCPQTCKDNPDSSSCPDGLNFTVNYIDTAPGSPEYAIVNGSSCLTGTAGPDIHDIYTMQPDGTVKTISLPTPAPKTTGALFGNTNYTVEWKNDELVETHSDTSGRPEPLVIHYQLKDGAFVISIIEAAPMYKTSYDCTTAKEEQDKAVCYVQELADLDIQMNTLYQAKLASATESEKASLAQSQQNWREHRNQECTIYKWWVDCLKTYYDKRIENLK